VEEKAGKIARFFYFLPPVDVVENFNSGKISLNSVLGGL
jgi:hypothetical protein